jgi:ArsR family transcriptional regulator, lead/cadmium/zinc/bismuth-responsive transcriptional repressor
MQVINEAQTDLTESPLCGGHEHAPHAHPAVAEPVLQAAARLGAALGDPSRLRLLALLAAGEHCVSELAEETRESLPVTSQRLRVLLEARLVTRNRDGRHVQYSLADAHVSEILEQLFQHCGEQVLAAQPTSSVEGDTP